MIGFGALVFLLLLSFPGKAQNPVYLVDRFEGSKLDGGAPAGWNLEVKEGEPVITMEKDGDHTVVRLVARKSSFGIKKEFEMDIREYPYLNWKWKVTKLPEKGNFLKKETDDQAAQLYVIFPRFPSKINTDFVCYYWESNPANKGKTGASVAWSKAKIIVLQAGPEKLNQWVSEKRNVYEDYKRLFGKEPPEVGGVAFYINSQHTQSEAESYLGEIYFSKK
jgi:hypothetical protein